MGITPSNPIYNNIDNIKIFQFILFTYVSSITFISLIIILILQLKKKKKGIISRTLKLITISEILNCIPKILNTFKNEEELFGKKKFYYTSNICYIQFIIQNFVDICTPLLSLIIAREIYYLIDINELSYLGKNQLITLISSILIPLIISIILFLLQIFIFNEITNDDNRIKNTDYVCYGSVYSTLIMLIIIFLLVGFSIYYSIKSSIILNKKKNEFLVIEEQLIKDDIDDIDDNEINENLTNEKISKELNKMFKKNLRYPILFSIIWLIFIICRGYDIYHYKINQLKKNWSLAFFFAVVNIFMCIRGLIYCFAFFSKSDLCNSNNKKLIENISMIEKKDENENGNNILTGINNDDDGPISNNNLEEEKVNS